jgi:hypothetical protein
MAPPSAPAPPPVTPTAIPQDLVQEIEEFRKCCHGRYNFNSFWDNMMNLLSMSVALGIIACGIYKKGDYAALLGGVMTALVSAQRAFPFNQRWQFYRLLNGQAENLLTDARQGAVTLPQAVTALKTMRLDFAQQIPRGASVQHGNGTNDETPSPPA